MLNLDYTLLQKTKEGYRLIYLYPNEEYVEGSEIEDEKPVEIWVGGYYYNLEEDLFEFAANSKANIYYRDTVDEALKDISEDYNGDYVWFESEASLIRGLETLKDGEIGIAPYSLKDFIVSHLNDWLENETFSKMLECPLEDIVKEYGFGYLKDKNHIYELDGDNVVEIPVSLKYVFEEILEADNDDKAKKDLIISLWDRVF